MLGLKEDFSGVVDGGIAAETTQVLRYVERILQACADSLAHVVKVSVYLTDLTRVGRDEPRVPRGVRVAHAGSDRGRLRVAPVRRPGRVRLRGVPWLTRPAPGRW
jgi:enamine deaminase RidA (YjgF/YER057c/UK114 family)